MRELFDEVAGQSPLDPQEAVRRTARAPERKRFYTEAAVAEADGGFAVTLDGRPIRTPSGRVIAIPHREIAEAVVAEWEAQKEAINPLTMPMTRFANSVVEAVVDRTSAVADDIARYLQLGPAVLPRRPSRRRWSRAKQNTGIPCCSGLRMSWARISSWPKASCMCASRIRRLRRRGRRCPMIPGRSRALHVVTTLTGSALLALALAYGLLDADQVWAAAHVDEDWNAEQWGADEEATERRAARSVDFRAASRILEVVGGGADARG